MKMAPYWFALCVLMNGQLQKLTAQSLPKRQKLLFVMLWVMSFKMVTR